MVPQAKLVLSSTLLVLALLSVSGCSTLTRSTVSPAEAALRAGALPEAVPPVPLGAEVEVAKQHFRAGSFGYAARYYEQAVATDQSSAEAWLGLAAAYDRLRRFDLADRAYREAASRAGATAAYHNNVGFSYLLRGDPAKARQSFLRALDIAPGSVTVRNNLELLQDASAARVPGLGRS